MDTIKQLKEEAQQLRKRLEILEQAVENVGNCKRVPERFEIWEDEKGREWLCVEIDTDDTYGMACLHGVDYVWFSDIGLCNFTFKRKAQL